jgi:diguanylate cyclase (GGDEF)-like protein/PAS domain S-box-containing protein
MSSVTANIDYLSNLTDHPNSLGGNPMKDQFKTKQALIQELASLRQRIEALEQSETDHKQAEEVLKLSQIRLSTIMDNMGDIVAVFDFNGIVTFVTESYQRILGYGRDELVGQNALEYIHPDDREPLMRSFARVLESGNEKEIFRLCHRDGQYIWFEGVGRIMRNEEGSVEGVVVGCRDITERKRAEEALRESEEKFRTIFDRASDGILIADAQNKKFLQGNAAICSMLGYTQKEIKNLTIYDLHQQKDISHVLDEFEKLIKGEKSLAEDLPVLKKDGSIFYADVSSTSTTIEGKHHLVGIFRDTTERKQAEATLHSEKQISDFIINSLPGIFYLFDDQGNFKRWNNNFEKVSKYPAEELSTMHPLNFFTGEDRQLVEQAIQNFFVKGEDTVEAEFVSKDGRRTPNLLTGMRITIGNTKHFIGMGIDITDRKRAEKKLRESEERYRTLVEDATDLVFRTDNTGCLTFVNPATLRITGYEEKEIIGKQYTIVIRPDMRDEAMKFFGRQFVKRIQNTYSEYPMLTKSGQEVWFGQNTQLIVEDDNVKGFQVVARDITERKRIEEALQDSENRYRELCIIDDLTQLYNSRYFYHNLKMEMDRADRYGQPLTLLLLDLDDFKRFNDAYGHVEGDHVLLRLGQVVKRCLRQTDSAYRYGGEEFTVLLPMTTGEEGAVTAERIRGEFKKETFSPAPSQDVHVTVSIGLGQYKIHEDMKVFVHRVDQLMYHGKENGKDRVCCES